jgi:hypothetical protein
MEDMPAGIEEAAVRQDLIRNNSVISSAKEKQLRAA